MTEQQIAAMRQALEVLQELDGIDTETECVTIDVGDVITALTDVLADHALDKKAENARELGIQMQPDHFPDVKEMVKCVDPDSRTIDVYEQPAQHARDAITWTPETGYVFKEKPAQGCDYCNHPMYAGTKCKHCGRESEQQEPFGYFRPEPFGWTDCAETDEGAIALYDRPQAREPLTDEEIEQCMKQAYATVQGRNLEHAFARAIERAHGITGDRE